MLGSLHDDYNALVPRIVLTAIGSYGDINPYLALGRELKRRGHTVVFAVAEAYRADVEREGLLFESCGLTPTSPTRRSWSGSWIVATDPSVWCASS
jgi:hypothetical protein